MADVYSTELLKWNNTSTSCSGYITLRTETFDMPINLKHVYKLYLLHTMSGSQDAKNTVSIAENGNASFGSTKVPSATLSGGSGVQVDVIQFSPEVLVESLQTKLSFVDNNVTFREVLLEYRPIYKRTTG